MKKKAAYSVDTRLTPRERSIVRCLVHGLSNRQIAALACIKLQTVKNEVSGVLRKLNVQTRTQAVILILRKEK